MTTAARKSSLHILLSAYSCEPGKGSEPGVGWHWAIEMGRLGHRVTVLTRENNRPAIEAALSGPNAPADVDSYAANLEFVFYDLPAWARWWKRNGRGVHLYYVLWQIGAYTVARTVHQQQTFDAVHHVTFGVVRHPSLMGRLGIPFVVGPLGGGEVTPPLLRQVFTRAARVREWVRDLGNTLSRYDPLVRNMYRDAGTILCKTPASLGWVPAVYRARARCLLEIGIDAGPEPRELVAQSKSKLQLVYVGRFLMWKGMDLGLRAIAQLRARGIEASLTMIGRGPDEKRWRALAVELGIDDAITWVPWIEQGELMALYASFDALLFPSLHDSSGNVVLEALAQGLPVVCLDLGGPAEMVNEQCGIVVSTQDRTVEQVVESLTNSLYSFARQPAWRTVLRAGARQRVEAFAWHTVVGRVWANDGVGSALVRLTKEEIARKAELDSTAAPFRQPAGSVVSRDNS